MAPTSADPGPATSGVEEIEWHAGDGPLNVAVVGVGYWGPNLVRILEEQPQTAVAAVWDASPDARARVGRRYPSLRQAGSYEEVLEDEAIEAVALATPISTHFALAEAALQAGKHVFVEKPLAASSDEATQLLELASTVDRVLMPGHTFLYSPSVNMIHELISGGVLGDVYFVSASRVNLGIHQRDGATVTWDLAPHDFSILRYWMGVMPSYVSAFSRSCVIPGIRDVAFINLAFPNETIAHVELSWLAPSKLRRTAIVGSKKMVLYDDTSREPVRIFDSGVVPRDPLTFGEFQLSYRSGDIVSPRIEAIEPLQLEMLDFYRAIREGTTPRSTPALGLDVVRMVEAVDRSLAAGSAAVPVLTS